jgi:hypothetical protein
MRILDNTNDKSLSDIMLLLTIDEAKELRDAIETLLLQQNKNDHSHINDFDSSKELTVSLYEQSQIDGFNERIQLLIKQDK